MLALRVEVSEVDGRLASLEPIVAGQAYVYTYHQSYNYPAQFYQAQRAPRSVVPRPH